ncbi:hypothetical protein [Sphingomicrobium aestuariivivum]|uniref:hypothetical protein n=1 Tax=Sphingomicrobium aestuariivivum TaxID=1582356 RepID=UPI001FD6A3F1|nr:hypothetical protein [Sphingomicrobium aestuariivivum]MCJ8191927.1 hypothetical protein [Sphingomicrobium aestuariivivum]
MRWMMVAGALALAGCQQAGEVRTAQSGPQVIPPGTAVMAAADMAPRGYPGRFGFTVSEGARVGGFTYLNSHDDYRDPRNLSVKLSRAVRLALESDHGAPLHEALKGKVIEVDGVAMRTKIVFSANGKPTDKYYYQTHVAVTDPANLHVID